MPETSIVIRSYNEEKHLGNLLRAIQRQGYKNYEVIIVDSGSTDRTLEIAEKFPVQVVRIESRDFTFGYALNVGCQKSRGRYLVFASAHTLPVDEHWLSNLIAPFTDEKVAMVYGRQIGSDESKFSEREDFKRIFTATPVNSRVELYYANNANSAVRRELWERRPFDEYLFGLEDIDWAKAMATQGYLIRYEPKAAMYHIHSEEWHQVFNRYRREAIAAVRIGLRHPTQAKVDIAWMFMNLLLDLVSSFPNFSRQRVEEIVRFRYYQWKGSRQGWLQGKSVNFERERSGIFYPLENEAVIIKDKRRAVLEEMPLSEIKPGDILIKVDYVGVCRTDLEMYEGTLGYYRDGLASYPIVPGHEFSGTIVRVGSNNKFQERFKVGQRVVGECILSRGKNSERKEVGVINHNGAYGTFIVMPGDSIHAIPDGMDSKTAVLTEPLAVVLRALRRLGPRLSKNSKVAVVGAGQIGNLCAQVLSLDGHKVNVYDENVERLRILQDTSSGTDTVLCNLDTFDVVVEATGSSHVLEQILKYSTVDSTILLLGFPYGVVEYNFEDTVGKEKMIIGSVGADGEDFERALGLLPKLHMTPFTQTVMPLKNFNKAWNAHRSSKYLKILLQP